MASGFTAREARLARRLLCALARPGRTARPADAHSFRIATDGRTIAFPADLAERLIAADLLRQCPDGSLVATTAGRAWNRRQNAPERPFQAQHTTICRHPLAAGDGTETDVNVEESPLTRLARRRDRHGRPLIDAAQLAAGERLRADFTRAGMLPNIGIDWSRPGTKPAFSTAINGREEFTDAVLAAKQRVAAALDAVGPEMTGVLLDVCCFLKGLETVERERGWPVRSAKVVLGLALTRLARHYGLTRKAVGAARRKVRSWSATPPDPDARNGPISG